MQLNALDLAIIGLYLFSTILIGIALKRKASKNLDSYFLGGKTLPWYMLSLSNASGMFDISGTMWLVTLLFIYGLKSIWIPWVWPVFNQVFLMVFLSIWLRRSNVLTGAEWITTRFGNDTGSKLSHMVVVCFAIIAVLGFLAYGFVGVGKFMEIFIPWSVVAPYVPFEVDPAHVPHFYGIMFTAIATFYVMMGGMLSIVWADLLQFTIMALSAIAIAALAMSKVSPEALAAVTPDGWANPFFGWELGLDWTTIQEVNAKIASDGYSLFSLFFGMALFKGFLVSAAGPAPNYDMQKILATKTPKEAALMSAFVSVVLMPVRYLMIAGFAVLALVFYQELNLQTPKGVDFERILPSAMLEFAPAGILGLLLAGLLAAFMGTFASTVNAAPAYLINDIYRRYINPNASSKVLIMGSYIVCVGVVVFSTLLGFYITSINEVLQWLVGGLWGGYTLANVLKWYWWRLNGYGYFAGMLSGIVCAIIAPEFHQYFPSIAKDIFPMYCFPVILLVSGICCVVTCLMTAPVDDETLKDFYRKVRPWGFWGPICAKVQIEDPGFTANPNFKRDMFNVLVGIVLQTALVALPIFIVIKMPLNTFITAGITMAAILILHKTWYKHLADTPQEEISRAAAAKV
jgi:solute:Na+ symporter, SSS family